RMSRITPGRRLRAAVGKAFRPQRLPGVHVQAEQVPFRAERVDAVAVDGRRGARAGAVVHRINRRVGMRPKDLAGLLVEANPALGPGFRAGFRIGRRRVVGHEHAAVGDGRPGISAMNRRAPANADGLVAERVTDYLLAPDALAVWPEPLRPV